MRCQECGNIFEGDEKKCNVCGAKIKDADYDFGIVTPKKKSKILVWIIIAALIIFFVVVILIVLPNEAYNVSNDITSQETEDPSKREVDSLPFEVGDNENSGESENKDKTSSVIDSIEVYRDDNSIPQSYSLAVTEDESFVYFGEECLARFPFNFGQYTFLAVKAYYDAIFGLDLDNNGSLYYSYFDNNTSDVELISENVSSYEYSPSTLAYTNEKEDLYLMRLDDKSDPVFIDDNVISSQLSYDGKVLYYRKNDDSIFRYEDSEIVFVTNNAEVQDVNSDGSEMIFNSIDGGLYWYKDGEISEISDQYSSVDYGFLSPFDMFDGFYFLRDWSSSDEYGNLYFIEGFGSKAFKVAENVIDFDFEQTRFLEQKNYKINPFHETLLNLYDFFVIDGDFCAVRRDDKFKKPIVLIEDSFLLDDKVYSQIDGTIHIFLDGDSVIWYDADIGLLSYNLITGKKGRIEIEDRVFGNMIYLGQNKYIYSTFATIPEVSLKTFYCDGKHEYEIFDGLCYVTSVRYPYILLSAIEEDKDEYDTYVYNIEKDEFSESISVYSTDNHGYSFYENFITILTQPRFSNDVGDAYVFNPLSGKLSKLVGGVYNYMTIPNFAREIY